MRLRATACARCRWGNPQPTNMTPDQVAWVAGILEGEGSFVSSQSVSIRVTMTDLDILERLQKVTGVGRIYDTTRRKDTHKEAWIWTVQRRAHIRHIIEAVLPWLGKRRTVAANKLLERIANARDRAQ